ncbi:MAG: MvaI/BcnI family restriction endonuclease [bacterium]|nr:MvaI/BcnI family restriction endonuclease [bacterium]
MQIYTKEKLIDKLKELSALGWVENGRFGNHGGIGNSLEDYLGIKENNLPIPNAAEWELKAQRAGSASLTTLFHCEPSPRAIKFVPQVFLPLYGWKHQEAGTKYLDSEMSFRQTISGNTFSDRGFKVVVDRKNEKVIITFEADKVGSKHSEWLDRIRQSVGLKELNPQPYWGFSDLSNKAGTKLLNCFYVQAETKKENGKEFYWYNKIYMLKGFKFDGFLNAIDEGNLFVDFDARTGHNHGTKFRLKQNHLSSLYAEVVTILG